MLQMPEIQRGKIDVLFLAHHFSKAFQSHILQLPNSLASDTKLEDQTIDSTELE